MNEPDRLWQPVSPPLQQLLLEYSRDLLFWRLGFSEEEPRQPDVAHTGLGLFVTLRRRGQLRGCIGSITTEESLVDSVRRRTLDAAFRDTRFPPLAAAELEGGRTLALEHSVLSPLQSIGDVREIRLGTDGVVLTIGSHRGVFLPEVPLEQGWSVPVMMDRLAGKAGLPADRWRRADARFQVFQTQHYQGEIRGPGGV